MPSFNKSSDQAGHLRRLARHLVPRARVLTLVSGKGGVGKSNIAANMSLCLAAAGRSVVLVDADLALANLDILFDLRPTINLAHLLKAPLNPAEITKVIAPGLRLLPGASGLTTLTDLSDYHQTQVIQILETLERNADFLVVDASAGLSSNVLAFAAAADEVLVVTTPEPTAVTDAYAVMKVLIVERQVPNISLVVNMAKSAQQVRLIHSRLAGPARRFLDYELPLAGSVSQDRHVPQAVSDRQPFVWSSPRCRASRQVRRLARNFLAGPSRTGFARPQQRYFARAASLFV